MSGTSANAEDALAAALRLSTSASTSTSAEDAVTASSALCAAIRGDETDAVREKVGAAGGVEALVAAMRAYPDSEAATAAAAAALSAVCAGHVRNKERAGSAGAVDALVAALSAAPGAAAPAAPSARPPVCHAYHPRWADHARYRQVQVVRCHLVRRQP